MRVLQIHFNITTQVRAAKSGAAGYVPSSYLATIPSSEGDGQLQGLTQYVNTDKIDSSLLCPLCTRPLRHPVKHEPCEGVVCMHCVWKADGICPHCDERVSWAKVCMCGKAKAPLPVSLSVPRHEQACAGSFALESSDTERDGDGTGEP